ncbi:MAG: hypothetical protein LBV51_05160 [Acholeplasmatales bacterium]|jgi:hypothetical protein|nr:hypothetical protein [Acholeplasmatales bacterium]
MKRLLCLLIISFTLITISISSLNANTIPNYDLSKIYYEGDYSVLNGSQDKTIPNSLQRAVTVVYLGYAPINDYLGETGNREEIRKYYIASSSYFLKTHTIKKYYDISISHFSNDLVFYYKKLSDFYQEKELLEFLSNDLTIYSICVSTLPVYVDF